MIVVAADVARCRRDCGVKLNHPEAIALISYEILEGAGDGKTVAELMSYGATIQTEDDVMEGIASLIPTVQVEATFPDGTKLVTVHQPICVGKQPGGNALDALPGEFILDDKPIIFNEGRETVSIQVKKLSAIFSPELVDFSIYVIDVAQDEKSRARLARA